MSALRLQLLAAPSAQKRRTASPAAYTEYLLGRQFFHLNNPAAFGRSVQAYEKSVALDAGYAPAWAGLALARFWFGQEAESTAAVRDWEDRGLTAAEKGGGPESRTSRRLPGARNGPGSLPLGLGEGRPAEALAASQRNSHEVFRLMGAAIAQHDLGHERNRGRRWIR